MALTRKLLKGMGLTEEQIDSVIDAHTETVDGLKNQIEAMKADAEKLPAVQKELDALKNGEDWKSKYEAEAQAFKDFKADTEAKTKLNDVKAAYRKLLTDEGISPKYIDTVIRATQFDGMKLDAEGKLEKADELKTAIGKDWSDFKASTRTDGAKVENPPVNNPGSGANPLAAKIAQQFHARRYGEAPAKDGANKTE